MGAGTVSCTGKKREGGWPARQVGRLGGERQLDIEINMHMETLAE